jgi:hypothetical protein
MFQNWPNLYVYVSLPSIGYIHIHVCMYKVASLWKEQGRSYAYYKYDWKNILYTYKSKHEVFFFFWKK